MTGSGSAATRRRSAAIFGNEKVAEVVVALHAQRGIATAQDIARETGIAHSMVRDVLLRLTSASVLTALPRLGGGSRAAQYYEISPTGPWTSLLTLVQELIEPTGLRRDELQGSE